MTWFAGLVVELWVEARRGRPAVNDVLHEVRLELLQRGARVRTRVLEHEELDHARTPAPDLVLLKSGTNMALSAALAGARDGTVFVNPAAATVRAHDKSATTAALAAAGLPVPETYLFDGATGGELDASLDRHGSWVAKPVRGIHGRGVVARDAVAATLAAGRAPLPAAAVVDDGTRLLQRRVGHGSVDVKAYVAGDTVFAGHKRFALGSYAVDQIEPVRLAGAEEELVRAVGAELGLTLFGVDCREDVAGSLVVVDANPFPGYRGFPGAVEPILRELERALQRA